MIDLAEERLGGLDLSGGEELDRDVGERLRPRVDGEIARVLLDEELADPDDALAMPAPKRGDREQGGGAVPTRAPGTQRLGGDLGAPLGLFVVGAPALRLGAGEVERAERLSGGAAGDPLVGSGDRGIEVVAFERLLGAEEVPIDGLVRLAAALEVLGEDAGVALADLLQPSRGEGGVRGRDPRA